VPFDVKIEAVTLTQLHTSRLQMRRWRERVKRGGSDRVKYNIITLIGSHKQEHQAARCYLEITAVGDGSIFSIYNSIFPQGIFRVGEGLKEQL
jgi:hypothetical protein